MHIIKYHNIGDLIHIHTYIHVFYLYIKYQSRQRSAVTEDLTAERK